MNKFMKKASIFGLALAILFLIGCENKSNLAFEDQYTAIVVEPVKVETIETVFESTGRVEASKSIKVVPEIPGALEAIYVSIGQEVKKGDRLMSIQSTEALAQVDLSLKQAKSQWTLAKEQLEKNKKKLKDLSKLFQSGAISKDAHSDMKLLYEESAQNFQVAEESLRVAQVAKNQMYDKFDIISPIDGIIKNFNGTIGSKDLSNTYVLVQGDTGYEVTVAVPEAVIKEITLETKGHVTVASTGEVYEGQVIKISEDMDTALGLYKIKMKLLSTKDVLSGQFVKTKLFIKQEKDQLTIPSLAVVLEETDKYVYTYNDEVLEKVAITTGVYNDNYAQILEGLIASDQVVVKGQSFIRPNSLVKVVSE